MPAPPRSQLRELALVTLGFGALTLCLTFPLALQLGTSGRIDNADGQYSIWNVAWVARALVLDPLHVFDANIFYPHRLTLAYSEANLGAGLLAIPVYWLTKNVYAANNVVFLFSFVLSALGTYYLVRYLAHDRRAATISAISFAFLPFLYGHIPHIQLLMTAGLPFSLLAFHRLADRHTLGRGAALGLAMAAQAFFCAYYGVFVVLIVGYAVIFIAATRGLWTNARYWTAVITGAFVAIMSVLPLALPYLLLQSDTGFLRSIEAARQYAATWGMYVSSGSLLHAPIASLFGDPREFLFPGLVALGFGAAGAIGGWQAGGRSRELTILYGSLAVLACWASFGPAAGLYRVLYASVPGFTFMRAPSRFGLIVALSLVVLAGQAIASLLARTSKPFFAASVLALVAVAELTVPLHMRTAPAVDSTYRLLATLPSGPVLELPVYSHQFRFARAQYILNSTTHWMPLVDAYSDYIPPDFMESMNDLAGFPSQAAFKRFDFYKVRYVVIHFDQYGIGGSRETLEKSLKEFAPYVRRLQGDERTALYEVVGFP
jgi:hypothetical protein